MTELDNASLHLYSMTSKGLNIKKELVKIIDTLESIVYTNEQGQKDTAHTDDDHW